LNATQPKYDAPDSLLEERDKERIKEYKGGERNRERERENCFP
jgi:hypothetical protein